MIASFGRGVPLVGCLPTAVVSAVAVVSMAACVLEAVLQPEVA